LLRNRCAECLAKYLRRLLDVQACRCNCKTPSACGRPSAIASLRVCGVFVEGTEHQCPNDAQICLELAALELHADLAGDLCVVSDRVGPEHL